MELIIASNNKGKIKEYKDIFEPFGYTVLSQSEKNIVLEVEETGTTFEENAVLKARAIYDITHECVISDDSGLEVEALNNEPGIYSARYKGLSSEAERRRAILEALEGNDNRRARFVTCICFIDKEGGQHLFTGIWNGTIACAEEGTNGFGYDPIFISEDAHGHTTASLPISFKETYSHRAKAVRQLMEYLKQTSKRPDDMRELFSMDLKDYNPNGKVFSRPSVRGIIARGDTVLLVYSTKYNYYKFPGGGPENGESDAEALIREVAEETGYKVIPSSIRAFGRVMRRQRDTYGDGEGIFEQDNRYYFCDVEEERVDTKLDDYEAEEGFTPVWKNPFLASGHNRYEASNESHGRMIERETKVLDMVDLEFRHNARRRREQETIKKLGNLDYAGMLDFVQIQLAEKPTEDISGKSEISYSRFEHTKRVLAWAVRLYDAAEDKSAFRYEDVIIATIFHDVGRNVSKQQKLPHALAGVPITRQYLLEHGFEAERTEYICSLVAGHSDKYKMSDPDIDRNLLLLMEADLLDDMGALGIVMDCMITERRNPEARFTDCVDHITRYTLRQQEDNPMVTKEGRAFWDEKTRIVKEFTAALYADTELTAR